MTASFKKGYMFSIAIIIRTRLQIQAFKSSELFHTTKALRVIPF